MPSADSNYWLTTIVMPSGTSGELPQHADVAIIGGGFTGLSAARTLAQRGVNVVVLEANSIGWGASSRNGGMVDESSAGVNPARYVAGLASAALNRGVRIYHNAAVQQITPASHNGTRAFTVQTSRGSISAENVFVATSGYTSAATPALRKK